MEDQIYIKVQAEYLGYTFKNIELLKAALDRGSNPAMYERLEILGDAVIESLSLYIARKILIKLRKGFNPELLHSIKVLVLSTEALTNIFIFHKLYRCVKFSENESKLFDFILNKRFDLKHSTIQLDTTDAAFKFFADTLEALFGALFMDGGWPALSGFFIPKAGPLMFFACKYFDSTVVDIIHDLIKYYSKRGISAALTDAVKEDDKKRDYVVYFEVDDRGKKRLAEGRDPDKKKARRLASIAAFNYVTKNLLAPAPK